MSKRLDLTGQKFGKLTAIKLFSVIKGKTKWLCQCECGNQTIVATDCLKNNNTKSCGCLNHQNLIKRNTTHNMGKTRFYDIWTKIKNRCLNKNNKNYNQYGKRGITIHPQWLKFENFRDDMLTNYNEHCKKNGEKNTTIERINNNGNYEPNNCKWATREEQSNNKRNNHLLTFNGQTLTFSQWEHKLNFKHNTLHNRINVYKWSIERALNQPASSGIRKDSILITYNNITLPLTQWCKKLNLSYATISTRIKRLHWNAKKALITPIKFYKKRKKYS